MQEGYPVYGASTLAGEGTHLGNQHSLSVFMVARCFARGVTPQLPQHGSQT